MKKRTGFLMKHDHRELFESLSNDQAGRLIKALMRYSLTGISNIKAIDPDIAQSYIVLRQCIDKDSSR